MSCGGRNSSGHKKRKIVAVDFETTDCKGKSLLFFHEKNPPKLNIIFTFNKSFITSCIEKIITFWSLTHYETSWVASFLVDTFTWGLMLGLAFCLLASISWRDTEPCTRLF